MSNGLLYEVGLFLQFLLFSNIALVLWLAFLMPKGKRILTVLGVVLSLAFLLFVGDKFDYMGLFFIAAILAPLIMLIMILKIIYKNYKNRKLV